MSVRSVWLRKGLMGYLVMRLVMVSGSMSVRSKGPYFLLGGNL
jgi:hypothetical protein